MVNIIQLAVLLFVAEPLAPMDTVTSDCWAKPLQISLSEIPQFGKLAETVVKRHCAVRTQGQFMFGPNRTYTVGRTTLTRFRLLGETLTLNIDILAQSGTATNSPIMYAAPVLDLPEKWDQAIDKAMTPVLVLGSAAIISTVVYQLLK